MKNRFQRYVYPVCLACSAILALVVCAIYLPKVAGDGVIHLIFMENAASGDWFEFNRGVPDPSTTSPLWTIFGAMIWKLSGVQGTLYTLNGLCFVAWLLCSVFVYVLARDRSVDARIATLGAFFALALPGTIQNSLKVMENVVFAAFVLGWLVILSRIQKGADGYTVAVLFGLLIGIGAALRPESVIVVPAIAAGLWFDRREDLASDWPKLLAGAVAIGAVGTLILAFYYLETGSVIPSSGVSRMMKARHEWTSFDTGLFWVYGATIVRIGAYAPFAIGGLYGIWRWWDREASDDVVVPVAGSAVAAGIVLYTFFTGAVHTGRYLIWIFPLLIFLSCVGADRWLQEDAGMKRWTVFLLGLAWIVGMLGLEAWIRNARTPSGRSIDEVLTRYENREERTDELLSVICSGGCCSSETKPEFARTEVHNIFYYDDRVQMASIDGTVKGPGGQSLRYDREGCSNAGELIRETREVVAVPATSSIRRYHKNCKTPFFEELMRAKKTGESRMSGWKWVDQSKMLVRTCDSEPESVD